MSFASELNSMTRFVTNKAEARFRAVALNMSINIISATPVDEGRAKGNWIPTVARASEETLDVTDPSGSAAQAAVASVTQSLKAGQSFFLVNNLPYIIPLEEGSSDQAPLGMVAVTVSQFEQYVRGAG